MKNLTPDDVPKEISKLILDFLNSAKSAKEIADRTELEPLLVKNQKSYTIRN